MTFEKIIIIIINERKKKKRKEETQEKIDHGFDVKREMRVWSTQSIAKRGKLVIIFYDRTV